jgi:antitoxin component of RelBE/YafQ-DinJ toxin-antitoxin module
MYIITIERRLKLDIHITNVDKETKYKAMYACKCKGTDLSTEVRKMVEQIAKDFDKEMKGE